MAAATTDEPDASPSAVVVVAADVVGRPVDEVEAALAARGLRIERVAEETAASEPGTVLAVTPTGALAPGDLVVVSYAVAPAAAPTPAAPTSAAATPAAPTSAATGRETAVPGTGAGAGGGGATAGSGRSGGDSRTPHGKGGRADGKGNGGNGKGNGKA